MNTLLQDLRDAFRSLSSRTIASFLYETSPIDPLIYAAVSMVLLGVTTVATLTPARRAARIDPMAALREQ